MSKYHLKQTIIENAKPEAKEYLLADGNGLFLRVRPQGEKDWLLLYSFAKNRCKLGLGSLRTTPLKTARLEAERAHVLIAQCIDPKLERSRRAAKEAEQRKIEEQLQRRMTVATLFEEWFASEVIGRTDAGQEVRRIFTKDVLPAIGERYADEVRRIDTIRILDSVKQRGVKVMTRNMLGDIRQMFNYALLREYIEIDPTFGLKRDTWGKHVERERYLDEDEIKLLATLVPQAHLPKSVVAMIWFLLATGCRVGEITKSQWLNVNFQTGQLFLPKAITKNKVDHTVFLSSFAKEQLLILRSLHPKSPYLLPSRTSSDTNGWKHIDPKFMNKHLSDRQKGEDAVPLKNRTKHTAALLLSRGNWTPHDLRRSCATMMGQLGVAPHIIEKCLNHVDPNKMQRIYQRQSTQSEQKEAWDLVGAKLQEICTPTSDAQLDLRHA